MTIRALCAYLLALSLSQAGPAFAQPREFQCVKAFAEMAPEYPRLVCAGNDWLERGRPERALEKYRSAAAVLFFESPNFLIYYRIAQAQAARGDRVAARETLRQFADMLAIYGGEKRCADPVINPRAADVMCLEGFNPESYSAEAGLKLRKGVVQAYRERVSALTRTYRLP